MKIALLTDGIYPYVIGGMQKHSFQLAKYFAQNKHTVYLFHYNASNYDIDKLEFFTEEEKQYIHSYVIPFPSLGNFPFHYYFESRKYAHLLAGSLSKVINEVDFIFVQGFCASGLPDIANRKNFPPVVLHLHGLEMYQASPSLKAGFSKYLFRIMAKANLKKADYTISFGGKITSILNKLVKKEHIWEIPGGINESWFTTNVKKEDGKTHFVFTGRYERRKGITELHSAIKLLLPSNKFTFDFIGPVPDEYKIIDTSIRYHGQLTSEADIKQILSEADVLVCPSYAEGMPYVIMEAMACGLAIMATDVGAVSQLVNRDNGWLINSPDVTEIFKTLSEVLQEKPEAINQKKVNSTQKIKEYTFEKVTNKLFERIEEALILP